MEIICYNVNVFTVTVDLVHPCRIKVFTVFIYLLLLKKKSYSNDHIIT